MYVFFSFSVKWVKSGYYKFEILFQIVIPIIGIKRRKALWKKTIYWTSIKFLKSQKREFNVNSDMKWISPLFAVEHLNSGDGKYEFSTIFLHSKLNFPFLFSSVVISHLSTSQLEKYKQISVFLYSKENVLKINCFSFSTCFRLKLKIRA